MTGLFLIAAAVCFAEPEATKQDPDVAAFLEASDAARLKELERLRAMFKDRSRRLSRKEAADTRKRIKELEKPKSLFTPTLELPLEPGGFGQLRTGEMRVFEVIDDKNMLAKLDFAVTKGAVRSGVPIVEADIVYKLVWVRGIDTAKFADREIVKSSDVFHVAEMKLYETTAGGREKVPLIEPFDTAEATKTFNERHSIKSPEK